MFNGPHGQESVKIKPFMQSNNGDTCIAIALADLGITLQPSFIVGNAIQTGELEEVMPNYTSAELGIYTLYPIKKYLAPKVRVLIDYLHERLNTKR